jgi:hypothetical protein
MLNVLGRNKMEESGRVGKEKYLGVVMEGGNGNGEEARVKGSSGPKAGKGWWI